MYYLQAGRKPDSGLALRARGGGVLKLKSWTMLRMLGITTFGFKRSDRSLPSQSTEGAVFSPPILASAAVRIPLDLR